MKKIYKVEFIGPISGTPQFHMVEAPSPRAAKASVTRFIGLPINFIKVIDMAS